MLTNVKNTLIADGFRLTKARIAVLEILNSSDKPLDVEELKQELQEKKVKADRVTLYRMLDAFSKKGLIKRLEFQEGKFRFELKSEEHHHFICDNCGTIEDIEKCPVLELEKEISKKQDLLIKRHSLEFFGICRICQAI